MLIKTSIKLNPYLLNSQGSRNTNNNLGYLSLCFLVNVIEIPSFLRRR